MRKYKWSIIWTWTILILSFIPKKDIPAIRFGIPHLDKVVHFTFYFLLIVVLLYESMAGKTKQMIGPGLLFGAFLGVATEYMQSYMHVGRSFEWADMAANLLGTLIGLIMFKVLLNRSLFKK